MKRAQFSLLLTLPLALCFDFEQNNFNDLFFDETDSDHEESDHSSNGGEYGMREDVYTYGSRRRPPHQTGSDHWKLVWKDEFNGPVNSSINRRKWLFDLGTAYPGGAPNWGTQEVESMTDHIANVNLDGRGHLRITPIRDSNNQWTSGRIETQRNDFRPPNGGILAVEGSIKLPNLDRHSSSGYWPAFWMLAGPFRGNYSNWPMVGEIDIMESMNDMTTKFSTFHCGTMPGGQCNEPMGISSGTLPCNGCNTGFHIFRLEWDESKSPAELRWYQDGRQVFSVKSDQISNDAWVQATNHGYMIILNVAISGMTPANADTVSGAPMLVDYVRVYEKRVN